MTASGSQGEHILVVDDDPRIRQMLVRYFEDEGFRITAVADGNAMRETLQRGQVNLILLDLILPGGEDGLALAREIRSRTETPIIMLTSRDDVVDKIVGLEIGADDYVPKPFHLRELLARIRTVLRRRHPPVPDQIGIAQIYRFDHWELDIKRRRLTTADNAEVALTTGEFDMLAILAKQPGHVFTRDVLMDLTHGRTLDAFDRTIDAQIARLRKKIERDSKSPTLIKSVRGVGYVFTGKSEG